jgi:hypothetical protein
MEAVLSQRIDQLVTNGWEPVTTTETRASLVGRRPFAWWLFVIVIFVFPLSIGHCGRARPRVWLPHRVRSEGRQRLGA